MKLWHTYLSAYYCDVSAMLFKACVSFPRANEVEVEVLGCTINTKILVRILIQTLLWAFCSKQYKREYAIITVDVVSEINAFVFYFSQERHKELFPSAILALVVWLKKESAH